MNGGRARQPMCVISEEEQAVPFFSEALDILSAAGWRLLWRLQETSTGLSGLPGNPVSLETEDENEK